MSASSPARDFAAVLIGTATSTAAGSCWRRSCRPRSRFRRFYMAGDRDLVVAFRNMDKAITNLATYVPQLRGSVILPGCGHWTHQERAAEVSAAMIDFLRKL